MAIGQTALPPVRVDGRRARKSSRGGRRSRAALIFVLPFVALFLAVYTAPIIYSIVQSFFTRRSSGLGYGGAETVFVWLDNYATVLSDPVFWTGVGRVFLFGIVQVPVMLLAALALALLLDSIAARGVNAFRITFFLPYAIPGIVAALLWSYLYIPQLSPISQGLSAIGIDIDFLGEGTVLWSIANISTWAYTGYNMLIIFASLKAISPDLYEAARMDGASEWTVARRIKVPAVRNALVLSGVLSIIGTLQLFTEPTVLETLSNSVGEKYVPTMYAFTAAFSENDFGVASATSIVIAVLAGVLSVIYYRVTTKAGS